MGVLIFLLILICIGFITVWIINTAYGAVLINQTQEQLKELSICHLGEDNYSGSINFENMMAGWSNFESPGYNWAYVRRREDGTWESKLTQETQRQHLKDQIESKKKYGHLPLFADIDEQIVKTKANEWSKFHDDSNAKIEHQYQQYQKFLSSLKK